MVASRAAPAESERPVRLRTADRRFSELSKKVIGGRAPIKIMLTVEPAKVDQCLRTCLHNGATGMRVFPALCSILQRMDDKRQSNRGQPLAHLRAPLLANTALYTTNQDRGLPARFPVWLWVTQSVCPQCKKHTPAPGARFQVLLRR
jgi:hypothetical protein